MSGVHDLVSPECRQGVLGLFASGWTEVERLGGDGRGHFVQV